MNDNKSSRSVLSSDIRHSDAISNVLQLQFDFAYRSLGFVFPEFLVIEAFNFTLFALPNSNM